MIAFVLPLVLLPQGTAPIMELKATYPYGEPLSIEATPDNKLAFVALGASISILDVKSLPPPGQLVIDRVKVPNASPLGLCFFEHQFPGGDPPQRWLFLASGSMGLWSLKLCPELFNTASPCSTYDPTQIDIVDPPGYFMRKRCLDLAVVPSNLLAGQPLLFAMFSASSDPAKSPPAVGPSELRAYRLNPDGTALFYSSILFPAVAGQPERLGTAVVSDPGDPNAVYVALGPSWLWKVNITTSVFTAAQVLPNPSCALTPCPAGEQMRDLALVRTMANGALIYAALDYGRIAEYDLLAGTFSVTSVPCGFPNRIAATTDGIGFVLIAVGTRNIAGFRNDVTAPYGNLGVWADLCLQPGGLVEPNGAMQIGCDQVRFYVRRPAPGVGLCTQPDVFTVPDGFNGSLVLRPNTGDGYRSYECRNWEGTVIRRIVEEDLGDTMSSGSQQGPDGPTAPPLPPGSPCPVYDIDQVAFYKDRMFGAGDGTVSSKNPGLTFFGQEILGGADGVGGMLYITPPANLDIIPVPDTSSVCVVGGPVPPLSICGELPPEGYKSGDPSSFSGDVLGFAHWPDPQDMAKEWFMPGARTWVKVDSNCIPINECTDPCPSPGSPLSWRRDALAGTTRQIGWRLISMFPGTGGPTPPSGGPMSLKWQQLPAPGGSSERTDTIDYRSSFADVRVDVINGQPIPKLIHAVRGASDTGYKIFQTAQLMNAAPQTCTTGGNGTGEDLRPGFLGNPYFVEAVTHVEFEIPLVGLPCRIIAECNPEPPNPARNLGNGMGDVFQIVHDGDVKTIAAIPTGYVTTQEAPPLHVQPSSCLWDVHNGRVLAGRPMVAFYDVTDVPTNFPNNPPRLLRVVVGQDEGLAWSVRTKVYPATGKAYAFVADVVGPGFNRTDVSGRLLVFDVSGSELFPPPPLGQPYLTSETTGTTILSQIPNATLVFPRDPYDGIGTNCIDIELDPDADLAYCALGRGGVAIVDISDPNTPVLIDVLDTPGLVLGIALRRDEHAFRQMIVGDSRAGMRLYGRPGE